MNVINENIEILITGYSHDGAGVGRWQGQVVFVPGTLLGEEVLAVITAQKKGYLQGELLRVIKPSSERVLPACGIYESCGGCQLQHLSYPAQLQMKEQTVRNALTRIGGLDDVEIYPVLGMINPWAYRNKGHFRVGRDKEGVRLGFVEEGTHNLVDMHCRHLFSSEVTGLLGYLEDILTQYKIDVHMTDGKGLKYILIRESRSTGEILLVFIHSGGVSEKLGLIAREICRQVTKVVGICENVNVKNQGPVLGNKTVIIQGKGNIEDRIGPFIFNISPASFFQVNNIQTELLYNKALEYAGLTGKETVVDAYCGIGTISLFLAQKAKKVIGIESVSEAVHDARKNAAFNRLKNVEFHLGMAEKIMPELLNNGIQPEVIIVDPPRKGCERALLDSIVKAKPERVVYVSCNPATLARDLKILAEQGYITKEVQPVDMFPQTSHVESIILMTNSGLKGK